jgi:hypothetical protein
MNTYTPDLFKNYFNENSMWHSHNICSKSDLHMYRVKTTRGQRCLEYGLTCLTL